ncbi:hypothetical protein C0Q70_01998 [Pomacea canaliculata]|uniref:Rho-GAP domain-containing protein n=1 Tax=Pomacea canaliculata TaxID=400727 RepID=A0A2T7Q126_POMCA|nr:hypothetical protein C0Q70_01998 [Pomacea canaliculata]
MRKFVSPRTGRKVIESPNKTFGVPLDELLRQSPAESGTVPAAVKRICEHIYKHGVDQEGIFRVSGSARAMDKLKTSFNVTGDADLEGEPDIMAVAGLLKLFLRELPDSLIPEHLTQEFIAIETVHSVISSGCLSSPSNQQNEPYGTCNCVWAKHFQTAKVKKTPPPRPPPPQIVTLSPPPIVTTTTSSTTAELRPVPSPRKVHGSAQYDSKLYQDSGLEETESDAGADTPHCHESDHAQQSPHFSDDETNGRLSPFVLESESHSIIESPMATARTSELVQRTICDAISDRLFGDELGIGQASLLPARSPETVTSERKLEDLVTSVRAKVEMYERKNSLSDYSTSESSSNLPQNGHVGNGHAKQSKADFQEQVKAGGDFDQENSSEMAFDDLDRDMDMHSKVKNISDSAKFHWSTQENKNMDGELTELLEETAIVVTHGGFATHSWRMSSEKDNKEDINHNQTSLLIFEPSLGRGQSNIQEADERDGLSSPQPSPLSKHKPFIPPLDLEASNTDVPPSPPKHQDQYPKYMDDEFSHRLKQMTKRIQVLKKKIKNFEEEFEEVHGYKPSQGEKAARPEIKKYVTELSRTRKDIKRLREDCEQGNRSRHGSGASSSGDSPKVEETLKVILVALKEKRQDASRPEDITLMSRDQVQEEKLAIQKALLHFEGLHGRPTSKEDKDLMRPLYDRYRLIKRLLAKPMSPRNSLDLPTVPEDGLIEIPTGSAMAAIAGTAFKKTILIPTAELEEERFETVDFAITRDLSDFRFTGFHEVPTHVGSVFPKVRKKNDVDTGQESSESFLHELNIYQLHEELEQSKAEKKQLRHHLREFEKSFQEKHGRKVQKEDRSPMQESYSRYKQVKARLRLLEALVLKHQE